MKQLGCVFVALSLAFAGSAMASDMPDLAKKSGCAACHAMDQKLVGPSWLEIARKYRGNFGAEAMLVSKVAQGGSGAWGAMPMPPNSPRVSDADIKTLVKSILGLSR